MKFLYLNFSCCPDRVALLESEIHQLQNQLNEQEQEANDAISKWQDSCSIAENRCLELENQLQTLRQEDETMAAQEETQNVEVSAHATESINNIQSSAEAFFNTDRSIAVDREDGNAGPVPNEASADVEILRGKNHLSFFLPMFLFPNFAMPLRSS